MGSRRGVSHPNCT